MGKIRVKTLGIDDLEKEQAKEDKKRREAKQVKKLAKGAHGGERVVSMAPSEEELVKIEVPEEAPKEEVSPVRQAPSATSSGPSGQDKKVSKGAKAPRQRSKRYQEVLGEIDQNRRYPISEAVTILKKIGAAKFDGTVELHINTIEKGVSGQVNLPHGTGKNVRVAIADPSPSADGEGQVPFDTLLAEIEKGNINFDVLIATPSVMPRLARVAKILGPRGLMPNPKNGTISDNPEKLAASFAKGQVNFRTESQAPIIHASIGKVSFKEKDLEENIQAFLKAVGTSKIRGVTVKSTMSPGVKIDFTSA